MIDFLALDALPSVYPQRLILKSRSSGSSGSLAAAVNVGTPRNTSGLGVGLTHLAELENAGKVTQVDVVGSQSRLSQQSMGALNLLAAQSNDDTPETASIIRFSPDVDIDRLAASLDADPEVSYVSKVPVRYATMPLRAGPDGYLDAIERRIDRLEADRFLGRPTAKVSAQMLWNLQRINLPDIEEMGYDDAHDLRVAVLDTGVDIDHPALRGLARYGHEYGSTPPLDVVGHGTHVAGTINSAVNPGLNTRGICKAQIVAWKIFDDVPDYIRSGNMFYYLVDPVLYRRALAECLGKADVVNLSIGGPQPPDPQEQALFRMLIESGITVVAAMGNERSLGSRTSYPAAIPGVVAVGATAPTGFVATFSNSGDHIALSAPGVGIWSTMPHYPGQVGFRATTSELGVPALGAPFPRDVGFAAMDGTSMATPHVSAGVALALANSRVSRPPAEVRDLLMITAERLPAMSGARWTPDYGQGQLDLKRLLFAAARM